MDDDLTVLRDRVPGYSAYSSERDRHDTDIRVRALLGSALTRARARAGTIALDGGDALGDFDAILMRCMFGDQRFVKRFEHADLSETMIDSFVASDRRLVDLAGRADGLASAAQFAPLVRDVEAAFAARDRLLEP